LSLNSRQTAAPDVSPLSLHAALPISALGQVGRDLLPGPVDDALLLQDADVLQRDRGANRMPGIGVAVRQLAAFVGQHAGHPVVEDRKSTRLNSSHVKISYAVFCLKKK